MTVIERITIISSAVVCRSGRGPRSEWFRVYNVDPSQPNWSPKDVDGSGPMREQYSGHVTRLGQWRPGPPLCLARPALPRFLAKKNQLIWTTGPERRGEKRPQCVIIISLKSHELASSKWKLHSDRFGRLVIINWVNWIRTIGRYKSDHHRKDKNFEKMTLIACLTKLLWATHSDVW